MEALVGATLQTKDGTAATADACKGKTVCLYFSAHWCGPCRMTTPELAKVYTDVAKKQGKPFEVVFVSSDRDQSQFDEYYGEMPWLAIPFSARDVKDRLSKKFKVRGIPSLVLVDGDSGATINASARGAVLGDPSGFPWTPPTLREMLSGELVRGDGSTSSIDDVTATGAHVALYFSAHWCPPCRGFTPTLVKAYETLKGLGKPFEVVFVSSDREQGEFDEYLGEMPWLALKYGGAEFQRKQRALSEHFGVEGIPSLVVLDADLNVVRADARGAVSSDAACANFPWPPPLVGDVDEDPAPLNENPSVVALLEAAGDGVQAVKDALAEAARAAPRDAEGRGVKFFTAEEDGGIASQIRRLAKLGRAKEGTAELVLLDLEKGATFQGAKGDVAAVAAGVDAIVKGFLDGSLAKKTLS